ncbi:hypothetical protein [Methanorbis rubei]|uniref:Uncharacterized protein n=1 Tax=Methanorbis rubei TaxID=3028300 RepID=A0AAE4MH85_9EURY|nr:hypothetical protein [Methanocorpusculaceae archaeon Cs1]
MNIETRVKTIVELRKENNRIPLEKIEKAIKETIHCEFDETWFAAVLDDISAINDLKQHIPCDNKNSCIKTNNLILDALLRGIEIIENQNKEMGVQEVDA